MKDEAPSLRHLPLALFAAPMGLGSVGFAWREAARVLDAPPAIGEALLALTALCWGALGLLHAWRAIRHGDALLADLRHPVRCCFAAAATIGLMIVAGALAPYAMGAARTTWLVAVVGQVAIAAWVVRALVVAPRELSVITPVMLLPLVGNILAPVFGPRLGFPELSWMMFGIGALLWAALHPLLLLRLATGPALPPRLLPSVVILLAPPAVGSLALAALLGGFGPAPLAVLGLAVLVALVLLTMAPALARAPFGPGWWAFTFPTGSFAAALLAAAEAPGMAWPAAPLWLALLVVSWIVGVVSWQTFRAAREGAFLRPEG